MTLIDLVFPKICIGCKRKGSYLCSNCVDKLVYVKQICPVCTKSSIDGMTHFKCISPHSLDGVYCVWENKGVIKKAIKTIKYLFAEDLVKVLAKQLIIVLRTRQNSLPKDAYLVPIPLHSKKYKWRGFNHAEEVGKCIATYQKYNFVPKLLIRTKVRRAQADLDKEHRAKNIRGVFEINKDLVLNKETPVIILDDVWTTGSTMREAGKVLKRNGFKVVWGLAIAH